MSEPQSPPGGTPDWYAPAGAPVWPQAADYGVVGPGLGAGPSWQTPSWAPPVGPPVAAAPGRRRGLVLALVGIGSAVAGAVAAAFLVSAVFLSSAEDIGREMAQGMGEEIGTSIGDGMMRSFEESMGGMYLPEDGSGYGTGPVEQSPPVPPVPGANPVLDQYAQNCFTGDLQACDDLFYESPPLSDYEAYAATCGGRVKQNTVMVCTDLD